MFLNPCHQIEGKGKIMEKDIEQNVDNSEEIEETIDETIEESKEEVNELEQLKLKLEKAESSSKDYLDK